MKMLKGFDFKAFFLDHGEKIGFGIGALLTLLVLAGTTWSRYPKAPEDILKKVSEAREKLKASVWPEETRLSFVLQDFMQKTHEVRGPLALDRYEFSTPLWHSMYKKQELRKEPEYMAVLDLDAKFGMFTLGIQERPTVGTETLAEGSTDRATAEGQAPAVAAIDQNDEFAPRTGGAGLAGLPGAAAFPGAGADAAHGLVGGGLGGYNPGAVGGAASPMGNSHAGGDMLNTIDPSMMMGEYGGAGGYGGMPGMKSRGERFIAVRGVWPIREQLDRFVKALNLQSRYEARVFLELLDFELERQTAEAGSDPWSGDWETVDITRAQEVLNEAFDYDFDPHDPRVLDPVVTMPLPARLRGYWGDYATHPKIKKFELTGPEAEREKAIQDKLQEEWDKMKLQESQRNRPKGGFANQSRNLRAMAETIYSSGESESMFAEDMSNWMSTNENPYVRMNVMKPTDLKARLTNPADNLLLFRYFDFDIRPGFAYRYRVRLKLRNPNFEQPPEQVVTPDVAQGLERDTPWSKESNVAVVPETVNYFIRDVGFDPVNEQKTGGKKTIASFSFFEWDATVGTMIHDLVQVGTYGQFVGENKKKTLRLDVAKPSFKTEEVNFRSDDLFLDAEGDVKIAIEEHKDLKVPSKNKGRVGILAAAVVVDRSGEIVSLDPNADPRLERQLADRVERERAPFKDIENKENQPAGGLTGEYDGGASMLNDGSGMYGSMESMLPKSKKKKKSSRKPTNFMMSEP